MSKNKKVVGYVRVSDLNKANADSQKSAILAYADRNNLTLDCIVEENISASKTQLQDRELMTLINSGQNIVVSDISRIGRNKVLELIGVIGQIASRGELHLAYDDRVINAKNVDDAETIFTVIGQSFASAEEAKRRSERAKAGHAKRKAQGLQVGRKVGQVVKSKLDDHAGFIISHRNKGTSVVKLIELLESEKGVKVSRQGYYKWLKSKSESAAGNELQLEIV
jgi:DNA invertase Pin-like site-specific DNA recombinase